MNPRLGLACAGCLLVVGHSSASIVNISTQLGSNPVQVQVGALKHVGTTLALAAGTYTVTPIDTSQGGAYTAAKRFGSVAPPNTGWEWNVWVSTDGAFTGVKHGYGEGIPANGGTYQPTAAAAFALAPAPFQLTFGSATNVTFYWRDDNFSDNTGGISIDVSPVPEPFTVGLAGAGLLAAARRRRRLIA